MTNLSTYKKTCLIIRTLENKINSILLKKTDLYKGLPQY